jgi:hypothetical protein
MITKKTKHTTPPIQRSYKEIIWFNNSAHIIGVEEPEKFQNELI